ncbi:MAG: hypothetical protein IPH12_08420 [Saprospirales bacterium]|nr:hypothetical protein [Saprospirales bacterium]MBK8920851.1 hypothetical protein [Saprospirales bacterium]
MQAASRIELRFFPVAVKQGLNGNADFNIREFNWRAFEKGFDREGFGSTHFRFFGKFPVTQAFEFDLVPAGYGISPVAVFGEVLNLLEK